VGIYFADLNTKKNCRVGTLLCCTCVVAEASIQNKSTNHVLCFFTSLTGLISGPVVDALTIFYKQKIQDEDAVEKTWDQREWSLTSHRAIILTGIVANVIACAVTLSVREIKVVDNMTISLAASADDGDLVPCNTALRVKEFVPTCRSPCEIFRETVQMRSFWRFLIVCLITVNVRMSK